MNRKVANRKPLLTWVGRLFFVAGLVAFGIVALSSECAHAQTGPVTVNTNVSNSTRVVNALSLNVTREFVSWYFVNTKRSLALDVFLDNVGGGVTAVQMTCQTCRVPGAGLTCADTGGAQDVHVIVSTSATGVNATVPASWSYTWAGGTDKAWRWTVSNLYSNYVNCLFTATGAGGTDLLTVYARGVTP